ncbi:hypothetical protein PCE1_002227 [Barthelona sp. PCE]
MGSGSSQPAQPSAGIVCPEGAYCPGMPKTQHTFATHLCDIDGRVSVINRYIENQIGVDCCDCISHTALVKALADGRDEDLMESLKFKVGISVKKHGSRYIVISAHEDTLTYPAPKEVQLRDLAAAAQRVHSWGFDARIRGMYLDNNLHVHEVDVVYPVRAMYSTCINCMDGRTQGNCEMFIRHRDNVDFVDIVTEAGPVKIMAEQKPENLVERIKERVNLSIDKHGSRNIYIIAHHGCAGNPVAEDIQKRELRTAVNNAHRMFSDVKITGLWVCSNWWVEEFCSAGSIPTEL